MGLEWRNARRVRGKETNIGSILTVLVVVVGQSGQLYNRALHAEDLWVVFARTQTHTRPMDGGGVGEGGKHESEGKAQMESGKDPHPSMGFCIWEGFSQKIAFRDNGRHKTLHDFGVAEGENRPRGSINKWRQLPTSVNMCP